MHSLLNGDCYPIHAGQLDWFVLSLPYAAFLGAWEERAHLNSLRFPAVSLLLSALCAAVLVSALSRRWSWDTLRIKSVRRSRQRAVEAAFCLRASGGKASRRTMIYITRVRYPAPERVRHSADGHRVEPQPGDILLFFRPHRPFDDIIQLATLSKYYHAALYAGGGQVVEARPHGVIRDAIGRRAGGYDVLPAPGGKGRAALAWAETQIGAGFDRWNMLAAFLEHVFWKLRLNIVPYGKYSCGELVATAYFHAGEKLFPDQDLDDVEPKDFARLLPRQARKMG